MGRPRTPIGTYGRIKTTKIADKTKDHPAVYEAYCRFRQRNGRLRPVRRRGPSATAAENNLKDALTRLAADVGQAFSGDSRFEVVARGWLKDFARKVDRGERAPKSLYDYTDTVDNHLVPRMGELTCREAEHAGLCDETLKDIRDKHGPAAAKRARTVMSGIYRYGVRHKAFDTNPVPNTEALSQKRTEPVRALEPDERRHFLTEQKKWITSHTDDKAHRLGRRSTAWTDLPEITEAMLTTGVRIGEVLAITGDDIDPVERTVYIGFHLVRIARQGMVRVEGRKGGEPPLTLRYPTWASPMWRRRKLEAGTGPIFATWKGTWEDPSNVGKRLRTSCDAIGYGWVSSRMFRHTVATHLGDEGMSNTEIGDQLGNTAEVVQIHYRRKRVANQAVADALENLLGADSTG